MTKVFIEPRPKVRPEGAAIEDFVVEEEGDRVLKTFKTQEEAMNVGEKQPHVVAGFQQFQRCVGVRGFDDANPFSSNRPTAYRCRRASSSTTRIIGFSGAHGANQNASQCSTDS
jgi:hypothetical protein